MTKFYIVATPIGNLEDITFRALRILKEVDYIACESKKETSKLLARHNIKTALIRYREKDIFKEKEIFELLKQGRNLALVSDSGTPCISDPGARLIQKIYAKFWDGVQVIPIPGSSAAIAALSVSGIPFKSFLFLGFPPIKKKRKKFFERIAKNKKDAILIYESPHRILKTLKQLEEIIPTSQVVIFKELTKIYETMWRGSPNKILGELEALGKQEARGEFVIVVDNRPTH